MGVFSRAKKCTFGLNRAILSQLCSDYIAHHNPEIVRAAARITLVVSTVVDAEILLEV
jgi:hypothetical protein